LKFLKSFSIYTTASFIEKGIAFFLLPIFTFYLSPTDFGYLALITSLLNFTQPLLTLGIPGAISVAYFKEDKKNYASYFSSSIVLPLIIALFFFFVLLLAKGLLYDYFHVEPFWIIAIPIFCFFSFINTLLLVNYQINNEPFKYVTFSLSNTSLNILLSLLLVITFKSGFEGRLFSQYASTIFLAMIAIFILLRKKILVKDIRKENVKDSLLFGLPLIPHIIGGLVISMSDRLFIDHFLGKEALGIYNIGYVIGAVISILCGAFANAIIPFSYELFAKNTYEAKAKVVKVYYLFVLFLGFIVLLVWLFTPLVFKLMVNSKFAAGSKYVIWITIGYFFQGLYLLFANIIFYLKKTKILFYWAFINVIINLSLNYFLVQKFGAMGAAYTLCISYFIFFAAIALVTHKLYPLPWLYYFKKKI
jgi:O-antigen/teichoic acid export membrane protein